MEYLRESRKHTKGTKVPLYFRGLFEVKKKTQTLRQGWFWRSRERDFFHLAPKRTIDFDHGSRRQPEVETQTAARTPQTAHTLFGWRS